MSYNSKYKSSEIEALLDKVASGNTGGGSGGSGAYKEVNHGIDDTTFVLTPNTLHVWDEVSSLTITLGSEIVGVANEFLFQFNSGATATSLTLPDDLKWAEELVVKSNRIYQVSILKGLASVLSWDNAPNVALINFTISGSSCQAEEGMTWRQWVISSYNLLGVYIEDDKVVSVDGTYISLNKIWVTPDELIVDGGNYIIGK